MKIEKTHYVIMKQGNIDINDETVFMKTGEESGFTNDILAADKFVGKRTALAVKQDYDMKKGYETDLEILPVKVTYEW